MWKPIFTLSACLCAARLLVVSRFVSRYFQSLLYIAVKSERENELTLKKRGWLSRVRGVCSPRLSVKAFALTASVVG